MVRMREVWRFRMCGFQGTRAIEGRSARCAGAPQGTGDAVRNGRVGNQAERGCTNPSRHSGGDSERDPPVPIPNTEVKPFSADGTWLETARESRTLPDPKSKTPQTGCLAFWIREKPALPAAEARTIVLG